MRILGLDIGTKRIGVAVSDELLITAQGVDVIERKSWEQDIARVFSHVESYGAAEIVVGLPLNMNGSMGDSTKMVVEFIEHLSKSAKKDIPIHTWDERLSTVQAQRVLIDADVSRRKRRSVADKLAAQLILQGYLDCESIKRKR
ncbi:MAG: Holliday junction resolvase RuvX [Candidatus Omnitrophota bacterium]